MNHKVEIPEVYLLILAVHGSMGDGEVPQFMKQWAVAECKRLGLEKKLDAEREERYRELKTRVSNVLGDDLIGKLERQVSVASELLDAAIKGDR